MPIPTGGANFGEHFVGVVAALAGDDDVAFDQLGNVVGIFELGVRCGHGRGWATGVGGGEEHRFNQVKVTLGLHALHQNGADHAAPANQAYQLLAHESPFRV